MKCALWDKKTIYNHFSSLTHFVDVAGPHRTEDPDLPMKEDKEQSHRQACFLLHLSVYLSKIVVLVESKLKKKFRSLLDSNPLSTVQQSTC